MSEPKTSEQYHTGTPTRTGIAKAIAEKTIPYRPSLKKMTGSTNSALLIHQIAYWWYKSDEKPFYKFLQPCEHENYRTGDSWGEELCFSYSELKTALDNISAKIVAGTSKKELSEKYAVIYWTDADRITWWQFNPQTFELLYNSEKSNYLDNQEKSNYFNSINTESNTKTTTAEKKKIKLPDDTSIDWIIAAGADPDKLGAVLEREKKNKETSDAWERRMGYNPLPWSNDKDLSKLLKFLITKTPDEMDVFARWSKRQFSSFGPEKARQYPLRVIELWPQAFVSSTPKNPYEKSFNL